MTLRSSRPDVNPMLGLLGNVHYALGILLVMTLGLIAWQHYGMERVVELTMANTETLAGDDSENDGASMARIDKRGTDGIMHCHLEQKYQWPYCRFRMWLGPVHGLTATQGMDLTSFDRMSLDVTYVGPRPHTVRVSLIDFEPGMSDSNDWISNKVNEIETFELPDNGRVDIPLNLFGTSSWWKLRVKRPVWQTGVRLDNVISFDMLTGSNSPMGDRTITVHAVRFHGKWISATNLLLVLVAIWILAAIGWPAMVALALRRQLNSSKEELLLLGEVNEALQLEAKELVGQAYSDPLTGVLNRQGLRAALLGTASLLSDPMCVVFMDIDHFKRINDTYGHATGDDVLRRFAKVIGANVRGSDKLVRWGGEEFLLVCTNTNVTQAAALAEKLRQALHEQEWPAHIAITASFGVAAHRAGEEFGDVIQRADSELYGAKTAGRDRVHADGLPKPPGSVDLQALHG